MPTGLYGGWLETTYYAKEAIQGMAKDNLTCEGGYTGDG
jgi:hypothetical protein